jgi:hypothetical protein
MKEWTKDSRKFENKQTIFMETFVREEKLQLLQECHSHCWKDMKEFVYIYCHCKKKLKMKINEH